MNKSYYANIPANVRYDDSLSANAKLLYGEITALANELGYCWASNQYFANLYKVHKNTISAWVSSLHKKEYIFIHSITRADGSMERRISLLRNIDPPTQKDVPPSTESFNPLNEKLNHNTTVNSPCNTTVEEQLDPPDFKETLFGLETKKVKKAPRSASPPKGERVLKPTAKNSFKDSQFADPKYTTEFFQGTQFAVVDWEYYLPEISKWSDRKDRKSTEAGWERCMKNWIFSDSDSGKLRTIDNKIGNHAINKGNTTGKQTGGQSFDDIKAKYRKSN